MGEIISYRSELSHFFRELNLEWLEEFFYVEPHDHELLDNCEAMIIDQGGKIFFYMEKDEPSGTFALIKKRTGEYELAKMAVRKTQRGNGIGQKMLRFCIDYCRSQQWNRLVLYSNRTLENSIHLYRKFGFREIPLDHDNPYARGDIKMELML